MEVALDYDTGDAPVRVIKVPRPLVQNIPNPRGVKFFEPWAKSVGVRRANGEFILTTNADSVHDRDLFQIYATRTLDKGYFYRVNRIDGRNGIAYAISRANGILGSKSHGRASARQVFHIHRICCISTLPANSL